MISITLFYGDDIYSKSFLAMTKSLKESIVTIKANNDIITLYKVLRIPQIRVYRKNAEIYRYIGFLDKTSIQKMIYNLKVIDKKLNSIEMKK